MAGIEARWFQSAHSTNAKLQLKCGSFLLAIVKAEEDTEILNTAVLGKPMTDSILSNLCAALDLAVLQQAETRIYRAVGNLPNWWEKLDPDGKIATGGFHIGDDLPFLREFLNDAEQFWNQSDEQWLESGIWQESFIDGSCCHFEASARKIDAKRILVIKRIDADVEDRTALLQRGRENKLAYQLDIAQRQRLEEELRRAKQAAEDLTQAKSDFLAKMTHELRTPMNGVIGMTEVLLESELTEQQQSHLQSARDSAHSLLRLINDILDFSKSEAGKLVLDKLPFRLRDSINDTLKLLNFSAKQKGLDLSYEIAADVSDMFVGDALRLRQIIVNLIGNAIKFTDEGDVSLHVQLEPRASDGGHLRFSVRDTGVGIPLSQQRTIFESFSQADDSPSRRFQGTGLGLSIAAQLVELMGGRIWVANSSSRGTTFCFTARLADADPSEFEEREELVSSAAIQSVKSTRSLRILVAEDNPINQRVASSLLEKRGHTVTIAENGNCVLESLDQEQFDIILMDCQMPEKDGFETTKLIRQRESGGNHIPIIALTAQADTHDQERCIAAGMDSYASKPFEAKRLYKLIEDLCNPHGQKNH